nr:hypothetical protein Iba_chr02cCG7370 [Ipomoea batatas]
MKAAGHFPVSGIAAARSDGPSGCFSPTATATSTATREITGSPGLLRFPASRGRLVNDRCFGSRSSGENDSNDASELRLWLRDDGSWRRSSTAEDNIRKGIPAHIKPLQFIKLGDAIRDPSNKTVHFELQNLKIDKVPYICRQRTGQLILGKIQKSQIFAGKQLQSSEYTIGRKKQKQKQEKIVEVMWAYLIAMLGGYGL